MDHARERQLVEELLTLKREGLAYLDPQVTRSPRARYIDPARFTAEQDALFTALPIVAAHGSELAQPHAFLRREIAGLPLVLTRDSDGHPHAFMNVCRHRGAQLVDADKGCKKLHSCPYHAWTYSSDGRLRGVPHGDQGFPDLDKDNYGLTALPCAEALGLIWIVADILGQMPNLDAMLAPLANDFEQIGLVTHRIAHQQTELRQANWKLLIEGGLEAYHFKVAHRATIAPYFLDNLSSYQVLGDHIRSILPRTDFEDLSDKGNQTALRDHANLLYTVFPTTQFLVQQDHVGMLRFDPLSEGQTRLTLATLVPADANPDDPHWAQNHAITAKTLSEDFDIGEAAQRGLMTGANTAHTFGRFEGALDTFNRIVEAHLTSVNSL